MALVIIEVSYHNGEMIPPVAVHADTVDEGLKEYENWYPGILTDPSFGIGEIKIKLIRSIAGKG